MIEPDLKQELDTINANLQQINKKTGNSVWRSFLHGAMSGMGSIVGVMIALAILGYILNVVGVIPAFRNRISHLNNTLDELTKTK
jgi:leucyl aminopeptidase